MNNDLISREALKNIMKCNLHSWGAQGILVDEVMKTIDSAPTVETVDSIDGYKNQIDDLSENLAWYINERNRLLKERRPQGEWIPVSERLPDKNMPCLVSVGKFNFTQIAMYSDLMETIDHKIFYQGDYGKNNFQNITEYVKAWQPLPEPYKKGGAENG